MNKFYEKSGKKFLIANLTFAFFTFVISAGFVNAQPPETIQKTKNVIVSPEQLSASFAEVAKSVEPAVVNIDTKGKVPEISVEGENNAEGEADDILEFFRRRLPRRPSYAVGSGFIVDKTGYILTNHHVVEDASKITVRLQSNEEYVAKIVGVDKLTDLAVLKIEANKDLPFIKLGDSNAVRIGDWVLAIGSPFGLAQTVTAGIISQTNRGTPYATSFQKFIQTDAAINRGNSGGPLVNMNGEVVGINSQIATSTGDYNGIGFALPANEANNVYRQILQNGKVKRGYLGVYLESVKKEFADVYGLSEAKGAIVTEVSNTDGAAAKAGLQKNDIIVSLDNVTVENAQDLITKVSSITPGKDIKIDILREAVNKLERKIINIKLDERPNDEVLADDDTRRKLPVDGKEAEVLPFGLTLAEVTPPLAKTYRLKSEKGLIIRKIDPAGFIADIKNSLGGTALSEGDLIQRINRVPVTDLKTFTQIVGKLKVGSSVVLHIASFDGRSRRIVPSIVQFTVQ
ncbi:MAG: Do family serine endopeptidase [Aridibacter sp.]